MNIDSFFADGKLHHYKGEDYAIHGKDYFIICDGCSSAKNSDITARLQAHVAKSFINVARYTDDYDLVAFYIGLGLANLMNKIGCGSNPLATLIIGLIDGDSIRVIAYGDGVIAFKNKNREMDIININYTNNAPFYPFYYTSSDYLDDYNINYPNAKKEISSENYTCEHDVEDVYARDFLIDDLEYLYIFSDGIKEFSNNNNKIDIKDAVKAFVNMKNTNGTFIQRRCIRQLKMYEKDNIFPMDDFSMSGVYF